MSWGGWLAIPITSIVFRGCYWWHANFLSLSEEESAIVSAFVSVHASGKQGKINKASVLTKLPHSLGPWRSLNWWNGWERGLDSYYEWWLGGVWDLLCGWGKEMEVMERRLCVQCYLWNVLRTSVCQIVENVKKYEKRSHTILWKVQLNFKILTSALLV